MSLNAHALRRASVVISGLSLVLVLLAWGTSVHARVTRIVIDKVEAIAGQPGYEQLTGRAWGALDPRDPHNAEITDLELAHHRRSDGDDDDDHHDRDHHDRGDGHHGRHKAEYIASFVIRKPTSQNLSVVSGLMWHDVPNRGGNVPFSADLFAAGDLHLLSGWQGDNALATAVPANVDCLPSAVPACTAPVFANHYVKTPVLTGVTGKILGRIINRSSLDAQPLNVMGNPIAYFPADLTDNRGSKLTVHTHE